MTVKSRRMIAKPFLISLEVNMKTRKSLFITIILSTTFTAGVAKAASESPMQCKINQGNIECTVVSDNVEITNVILNRGRCDAPEAATQKDIEALN